MRRGSASTRSARSATCRPSPTASRAFKEDLLPASPTGRSSSSHRPSPRSPRSWPFGRPLGPMVSMFGHQTPLQVTDVPVACSSCWPARRWGLRHRAGGWASGSTYPLLGGLRSAAQMICYEVAMGLSIVAVFIYAGTMSTSEIVAHRPTATSWSIFGWSPDRRWYAVLLPPASSSSSSPRRRDQPGAVRPARGRERTRRGLHTEYSSIKFLLYMLSEYVAMVSISALVVTLFLGGWRAPWPITLLGRRQRRLVAPDLVRRSRSSSFCSSSSGARHTAPASLRPVHAARLEGAAADQPAVDPAARLRSRADLSPARTSQVGADRGVAGLIIAGVAG